MTQKRTVELDPDDEAQMEALVRGMYPTADWSPSTLAGYAQMVAKAIRSLLTAERDEARDLLADYEDVYDRNRDLLRECDEALAETARGHAAINHEHELRLAAEAEVQRLRDGITALADNATARVPTTELRALLAPQVQNKPQAGAR